MERFNAFIQSLRQPSPPSRSFSYSTKGSLSRAGVRRRASAGDLLTAGSSPTPPPRPSTPPAPSTVMDKNEKTGKRKTLPFSFRDLFRSQPNSNASNTGGLPIDHLPRNNALLDGLANYHLGQLDRLKRELKQHNRNIDHLSVTYSDLCRRGDMKGTADMLKHRIRGALNSRNLLSRFVAFHLQELERILELKGELGLGKPVPNLFVNLPTDAEWNQLFK